MEYRAFQITNEEECCILDADLADWLGFSGSAEIQSIIKKELNGLRLYGEVFTCTVEVGGSGDRTGYLLNADQAVALTMAFRSPRASYARDILLILLDDDDPDVHWFLEPTKSPNATRSATSYRFTNRRLLRMGSERSR